MISANGQLCEDFISLVKSCSKEIGLNSPSNNGELLAFAAYARAFPKSSLFLVDTYDTLQSGVPNFLATALALHKLGYKAKGIRLDSGDLAYLSVKSRKMFKKVGKRLKLPYFYEFLIVASNDLNVETINSLNQQGHQIDIFGVGTNLVTCQSQPALGCVYKLVSINQKPRIKLSQEIAKLTIPGIKNVFRIWSVNTENSPVIDLIQLKNAAAPEESKKMLCRHPFAEHKRVFVTPTKVVQLLHLFFEKGNLTQPLPTLSQVRDYSIEQILSFRPDHLRYLNPTPYKVSVSTDLYNMLHNLWLDEAPIGEL